MRQRMIGIALLVVILGVGGWFYYTQMAEASSGQFVLSGTIEATESNVPTRGGGVVKQVYVNEGDQITQGQALVSVYNLNTKINEKVRSSLDGVVLERLVEPEEMANPGSTVMVIAPLNALTVKVYLPEDRYGQVSLGESYPLTVDSFPNEIFYGTVSYISDKAEFTPRNVQTTDSRKTTVYAITLNLDPTGGKLKPGMPADVHFGEKGE